MIDEYPVCGICHTEMVQLEGFMTFYCPCCSSKQEAIDFIRKDETNPEILKILDEIS